MDARPFQITIPNWWYNYQGSTAAYTATWHANNITTEELYLVNGSYRFRTQTGTYYIYRRAMESECYRYAPPGTPSSITYLTSVSPGQAITVSWSNVSTADRYELQYRYQNTNGTWESWQTVSSSLTGTSRSFTVSSSSSYNAIQFRVLADNSHTMRDTHYGTDIPTEENQVQNRFYSNTNGLGYTWVFTAPTSDVTAGSSVTVRWGAIILGQSNFRLKL